MGKQRPALSRWREVEDVELLAADSFPALVVGIEMSRAEQAAAPDCGGKHSS